MTHSMNIRWRIPFVLLVSVLISYFDRMNISYAIPVIAKDYGWGVEEIGKNGGLLMSIFFVGYGLGAIIAVSMLLAKVFARPGPVLVIAGFFAIPLLSALISPVWGGVIGNAVLGSGFMLLGRELKRN